METSQAFCKANHLAGLHMIRAFTGRFFCTDDSINQVEHLNDNNTHASKKCIKARQEYGTSILQYSTHKVTQSSVPFSNIILFQWDLHHQSYQLELQCNLPKNNYVHQKQNVQINLPAYVLTLIQLFCCYPYSCSSDKEIDQQQSVHIPNHKFYTVKDKLGIYDCNSSCDLFCIAFQSEKIQMYPFQQGSNRL